MRQKDAGETDGKVYTTVTRPVMGPKRWQQLRNEKNQIIEVNEMKMLLWMCGVTLEDNIRTETYEEQRE